MWGTSAADCIWNVLWDICLNLRWCNYIIEHVELFPGIWLLVVGTGRERPTTAVTRGERERERECSRTWCRLLLKKKWELYGVLRQPSFRNHPYGIISCLCTTTLPYINKPEALGLRIVLIEICSQHHRYICIFQVSLTDLFNLLVVFNIIINVLHQKRTWHITLLKRRLARRITQIHKCACFSSSTD